MKYDNIEEEAKAVLKEFWHEEPLDLNDETRTPGVVISTYDHFSQEAKDLAFGAVNSKLQGKK